MVIYLFIYLFKRCKSKTEVNCKLPDTYGKVT